MEVPSTRNVSDACERFQVSRRTTVKNSVIQHGDLVLYALRYPKPTKANERISDVIGALQVEDQPCRRVQHRLESAQEVGWDANQHAVAVVQSGVHQSDDQHLKRGCWHAPTDLAELMQRSKTARYRSLNMYPHRQISVDANAQITDKQTALG